MYQWAVTSILRTLFWNLCTISIFELLAVPHKGTPYVHMGFSTVLYSSSWFASESSDILRRIQHMRWNINPSCFLLVKMCVFHVSLRSRWMPRYLTVLSWGMCFPFSKTTRQCSRFRVKVACVDLIYKPQSVDVVRRRSRCLFSDEYKTDKYSVPSSYDRPDIRTTWVTTKILVLTYDQSLELRSECRSRPKRVSACAVVNKDPKCVRKRQSEPR
jgi:hypothetical protein